MGGQARLVIVDIFQRGREVNHSLSEHPAGLGCKVIRHKSGAAETLFTGFTIPAFKGGGGARSAITGLSGKSGRRMAFEFAKLGDQLAYMETLTMPPDAVADGRVLKKALNVYLQRVRRDGGGYGWFLEFQRNNSPHFHVFLTKPTSNNSQELSKMWAGIYCQALKSSQDFFSVYDDSILVRMSKASGRTERLRKEGGAWRYAMKYACKSEQKEVPSAFENVGRFWGIGGTLAGTVANTEHLSGADALAMWELCQNRTPDNLPYVRRKHFQGLPDSRTRGRGNQ